MKSVWEKLKKWGKVAWAIIGVFVVLLAVWSAYDQYYKKPNLSSQIVSEINVLDINEPLKDLQILFQGDNIQEKNLNLRIYRVKIENIGGTNIIQNDFDQNDSWGIQINQGRFIETRLIDSNSDYVRTDLIPMIQNDGVIKFNKVIFDKGNYFTVELLVLHDKSTPPTLYRIGKVAGIKENKSEILAVESAEPFWPTLFYGDWLINLVRAIIYFILSVSLFIAIIILIVKITEKRKRTAQNPQQPPQQPS